MQQVLLITAHMLGVETMFHQWSVSLPVVLRDGTASSFACALGLPQQAGSGG